MRLELHAEGELELSHGNIWIDVGDDAAVGAVNTARSGGIGYVECRVIEDVEGLELELAFYRLGYWDVLQERGIGHVLAWAGEGVAADVAEGCEGRTAEWAGTGADRSG